MAYPWDVGKQGKDSNEVQPPEEGEEVSRPPYAGVELRKGRFRPTRADELKDESKEADCICHCKFIIYGKQ